MDEALGHLVLQCFEREAVLGGQLVKQVVRAQLVHLVQALLPQRVELDAVVEEDLGLLLHARDDERGDRFEPPPLRFVRGGALDPGELVLNDALGDLLERALLVELRQQHRELLAEVRVAAAALRQLEAEVGVPSWSPNEEAFMAFVERATAELPAEQRELLRNAEVFVVDLPGPEMIVDGVDVHAMVMLDLLAPNPPAKVLGGRLRAFVYAVNVLRTAGAIDQVEETLREAFERELAHLVDELGGRHGAN